MLDYNETTMMTKALDRAVASSKTWSEVAHKTFVEMATKARDDVTKKGDFSFIRQFRMQFAIPEQTQTLNDRTLETQFNLMMQPVYTHFAKFANDYEQANKRTRYMEMLRSGQKDEFLTILRSHLGKVDADFNLTQDVWKVFNQEEQARQQREKDEERKQKMDALRKHQELQRIETEAKRRIEQEAFELAVQAKVRELKQ